MTNKPQEEHYRQLIRDLIRLWQVAIAKQLALQTWLEQHPELPEWRGEGAEHEQANLPQQLLITEKFCELLLDQQSVDLDTDWQAMVRRVIESSD